MIFRLARGGPVAACGLMGICHGDWSLADFAIGFRTRAHRSSWNPSVLFEAFLFIESNYVKDKLFTL